MSDLDSRLLRNYEDEKNAAEVLNEKKRGTNREEGGDQVETGDESGYLKRIRNKLKQYNFKEQAKKKMKEVVVAPINRATSRALQWAWKSLIPSWGLSSIWINIHVFLKSVFGEKLFCKLGEEWLPKKATDAAGGAGKVVTKSVGLVEVMVLVFIDLIIFFIIVGFVSLFTNESTFKEITGESKTTQQQSAATPAMQK